MIKKYLVVLFIILFALCSPAISFATEWAVYVGLGDDGYSYCPTLADINNDGAAEIFLVGENCFALYGGGTIIDGWPQEEQQYQGYWTNGNQPGPSVVDIDLDGQKEILWSIRDWWGLTSRTWCFNAKTPDGTNCTNFPQQAPEEPSNALISPLVVGDINNDGPAEMWAIHTLGNNDLYNRLTAVDNNGNVLFTHNFGPEEALAPYWGDLDGDGQKEIFVLTYITDSTTKFYIHAFLPQGEEKIGFPTLLLETDNSLMVEGPPIPVDLDLDGDLELLIAWYTNSATSHSYINALHHDGQQVINFPPLLVGPDSQTFYISLGDLTGDNYPELIVTDKLRTTSGVYRVYAYNLIQGCALLPGWPYVLSSAPKGTPLVVDVDNDGQKDIILSTVTGKVLAINLQGNTIDGFPRYMNGTSYSGVAAGDTDGDGLYELITATSDGWIYSWDTEGQALPGRADWTMRGVDLQNSGVYVQPQDPVNSIQILNTNLDCTRITPNPSDGHVSINFNTGQNKKYELKIFNIEGKCIFEHKNGPAPIMWDGTDLVGNKVRSGTYLTVLHIGKKTARNKILIIR